MAELVKCRKPDCGRLVPPSWAHCCSACAVADDCWWPSRARHTERCDEDAAERSNVVQLPIATTPWCLDLVPPAVAARDRSAAREQITATDVGNRALQLYDLAAAHLAAGGQLVLRHPDGSEDPPITALL